MQLVACTPFARPAWRCRLGWILADNSLHHLGLDLPFSKLASRWHAAEKGATGLVEASGCTSQSRMEATLLEILSEQQLVLDPASMISIW